MAIPTLARKWGLRLLKIVLFLLTGIVVGRALGNPEVYINHEFASKLCNFLHGDINAETMYDTYFYIDFTTVVFTTGVIYFLTLKLIRKIKSN